MGHGVWGGFSAILVRARLYKYGTDYEGTVFFNSNVLCVSPCHDTESARTTRRTTRSHLTRREIAFVRAALASDPDGPEDRVAVVTGL